MGRMPAVADSYQTGGEVLQDFPKAPNATSCVAIAEADEIVKSRRARFATADSLLNDLEEASSK